jgi:dipeptidase D
MPNKYIMSSRIIDLSPSLLWKHFHELTQIPRPSKHEQRIVAYIQSFGREHNLETMTDKVGNVVIKKPATKGCEHLRTVVMQSHVDMVPQKNSGVKHNFETDPIHTYTDGDWVKAENTTLGADNGIGVAAILAVLESKNLNHGPVEGLFTVDEETGMTGAFNLQKNFITNDILINLDNEDDHELCVGCAGGVNTDVSGTYDEVDTDKDSISFLVELKGLKGGHSGMDINLNRANAILLLNRVLADIAKEIPVQLAFFNGGDLRNAIPREAFAQVVIPAAMKGLFEKTCNNSFEICKNELKHTEPDMSITLSETDMPHKVMSEQGWLRFHNMLSACPNGVIRMSDDIPGLVETSSNMAIFEARNGNISATLLQRSSVDSAKDYLCSRIRAVFELGGCCVDHNGAYPGWQPNMDSAILDVMRKVYTQQFGEEPKVLAVHAGLECGIIGSIYPGIDCIAVGPLIQYPHSPDEQVSISSVQKFWELLTHVLPNIPFR